MKPAHLKSVGSAFALVTLAMASTLAPLNGAIAANQEPSAQTTDTAVTIPDAVAKATQKDQGAFIKTADEAFKALREVRAARIAIFNGDTDNALKFVTDAKSDMEAAKALIPTHGIKSEQAPNKDDFYIPFDTSIRLSEGFVPTDEKSEAISKANEHLAKGEQKQAQDVLKLANIEVAVSAALIPAETSVEHLQDASRLLDQHKYYEANLALKALEDTVLVESYAIDGIPTQEQTSTN